MTARFMETGMPRADIIYKRTNTDMQMRCAFAVTPKRHGDGCSQYRWARQVHNTALKAGRVMQTYFIEDGVSHA